MIDMGEQQTKNQHYLPKYRMRFFLGADRQFDVIDLQAESRREKRVGVNCSGLGAEQNLYEIKKSDGIDYVDFNLTETQTFANGSEKEEAKKLKAIIGLLDKYREEGQFVDSIGQKISIASCLPEEDFQFLCKYIPKMLMRLPDAAKNLKQLVKDTPEQFHNFYNWLFNPHNDVVSSNTYHMQVLSPLNRNRQFWLPDIGVLAGRRESGEAMIAMPLTPIYLVSITQMETKLPNPLMNIVDGPTVDYFNVNIALQAKRHVIIKKKSTHDEKVIDEVMIKRGLNL